MISSSARCASVPWPCVVSASRGSDDEGGGRVTSCRLPSRSAPPGAGRGSGLPMRWLVVLALLGASPARAESLAVSGGMSATHIHGFQAGVFGADVDVGWRHGTLELHGVA